MYVLIHNALGGPVDYDGIKLIRRPSPERVRRKERGSQDLSGFSKAATYKKLGSIADARKRTQAAFYTVVDIETTGFSPKSACVYLIGCAFRSKSGWKIRQYFA